MTNDTTSEPGERRRRTERILLRIPIEVKGTDADGKAFKEKTYTLAINRHGARVALNSPLEPEAQVTITNLQNKLSCPFRVVARVGKSLGEGPEWGMECLQPQLNFWGIFFPEKLVRPGQPEVIDTLLECSVCHCRELAQLTLEQYQTIITHPSLSRDCQQCGVITEWKFGYVEGGRGAAAQVSEHSSSATQTALAERRRAKRVPVKMPVRIRLEEIGQTENLSTSGVCFSSDLVLRVGDRVQLTVGYDPKGSQKEVPAHVVWRRPFEGTKRALYGVQLEEDG
jgi:hypothetical protein